MKNGGSGPFQGQKGKPALSGGRIPELLAAAVRHHRNGNFAEAEGLYRSALDIDPDCVDAQHLLGVLAHQMGKSDVAADFIAKALARQPDSPEMHNNLGLALRRLGRVTDAVASFHRALALRSGYPEAHNNLGNVLNELGQPENAADSYRKAVALRPDFAEAHYNLANVLRTTGRLDAAAAGYRKALALKPNFPEAHNNLGGVLCDLGQWQDAAASCDKALSLRPNFPEAHNNLGRALKELGRLNDAVAHYEKALALDPDSANTHSNLGSALASIGCWAEARAHHLRAMEIEPHVLNHAIHAHLHLPAILESAEVVDALRERYRAGIDAMADVPGIIEDHDRINTSSFFLAYHDRNDRPAMLHLHDFFRGRLPELTLVAPHVPDWRSPTDTGRKIRVGFLSEYLTEHTIGKLYRGLVRHLDRRRFEVVVIHTHKTKLSTLRQEIDAAADQIVSLPAGLAAQQQAVAAMTLDILFYPDIGMTPTTYFLAYARLAPVQAVAWGHPDTTGLDSMDYFVSSSWIEPEDAEAHYSERLICLNRLPCYFEPLMTSDEELSRSDFGLPDTGTLYGCPQSLFKLHPDFDAVLAAIAAGDSEGHVVLLEGSYPIWRDMLVSRWKRNFPDLPERVLFLPRMPLDRFMTLTAGIDILLDPPHFGSGNTFYEAMVYGTPVVTWPGRFMRSRIVAGGYRQMGLTEPLIAANLKDYARLALDLGRDPERRRSFRREAREAAKQELFSDTRFVREFEAFLEAAAAAAGRREKLPAGWHPDPAT